MLTEVFWHSFILKQKSCYLSNPLGIGLDTASTQPPSKGYVSGAGTRDEPLRTSAWRLTGHEDSFQTVTKQTFYKQFSNFSAVLQLTEDYKSLGLTAPRKTRRAGRMAPSSPFIFQPHSSHFDHGKILLYCSLYVLNPFESLNQPCCCLFQCSANVLTCYSKRNAWWAALGMTTELDGPKTTAPFVNARWECAL